MQLKFTAYTTPQPQGSVKAFVLPNKDGIREAARRILESSLSLSSIQAIIEKYVGRGRAILTSDNDKLKPYRAAVSKAAKDALWDSNIDCNPMAGRHVPVALVIDFYMERPESCPKRRLLPAVRPDLDKLLRSTLDALTEIVYEDDGQVVDVSARKYYGDPERVEVSVTVDQMETLF